MVETIVQIGVRTDFSEIFKIALEYLKCTRAAVESKKNHKFEINRKNNLKLWYSQKDSRSFKFRNFS